MFERIYQVKAEDNEFFISSSFHPQNVKQHFKNSNLEIHNDDHSASHKGGVLERLY